MGLNPERFPRDVPTSAVTRPTQTKKRIFKNATPQRRGRSLTAARPTTARVSRQYASSSRWLGGQRSRCACGGPPPFSTRTSGAFDEVAIYCCAGGAAGRHHVSGRKRRDCSTAKAILLVIGETRFCLTRVRPWENSSISQGLAYFALPKNLLPNFLRPHGHLKGPREANG